MNLNLNLQLVESLVSIPGKIKSVDQRKNNAQVRKNSLHFWKLLKIFDYKNKL